LQKRKGKQADVEERDFFRLCEVIWNRKKELLSGQVVADLVSYRNIFGFLRSIKVLPSKKNPWQQVSQGAQECFLFAGEYV
jgi:hypothetical protein